MNIFFCIDDTDNLDSPGSGQLAEVLANKLQHLGMASGCSTISRHQLFVHESIPYTSHNSAMCFSGSIEKGHLDEVILYAKQFLKKASAPGSDPGLCVAAERNFSDRESLISFGLKAKQTILTKQEAYALAGKTGVHLSEHGGTGDGVIGALAGIGLRLHGNDGRIRGWLNLGKAGQISSPGQLCCHPLIDDVVDDKGIILPEKTQVALVEKKIKTVLMNHRQVVPVTQTNTAGMPTWTTLTRSEIKRF